jgi:hypothetical protein
MYWPASTVRRILNTSLVVHRWSLAVSHERSGRLLLVWPPWQMELMALVNGDAEDELRALSIQENRYCQLHEQQVSARIYELDPLSYKEAFQ